MSKTTAVLLFLGTTLLGACFGAYADYAPTRDVVPRAPVPPEAVAVYFRDPPCPYTEIGLMEAHDGSISSSLDDKLWAMRARAGRNGANGVMVIDHQDAGDHHGTDHHYSGLAIVVDRCMARSPCGASPGQAPCPAR